MIARALPRPPSRGLAPPAAAAPLTVKSVRKMVDQVVAKEKGATKREVLMKLVQDHPRASVSLDASRAHHHGQGLEEHHQRTTAAPTWSVYDTMHH